MSLSLTSLDCVNFRSLRDCSFELGPGLTLFVGPNAVGKTNTVEALQLLTAGCSFRKPLTAALVREGAAEARIHASVRGDGRVLDLGMQIKDEKRRFFLNEKPVHAAALPQVLMSVLFTPDDLWLVKRGASARRDEVDTYAKLVNTGYAKVLSAYTKAVQQRNSLLGEDVRGDLLAAWDETVAVGGATLLLARAKLVRRLGEKIASAYEDICPGERLECRYLCSLEADPLDFGREELVEVFLRKLEEASATDRRRGQTTVGPHRDDVEFLIDGRSTRQFASQGQQRSVALALKVAEVELAREVRGSYPLLLLDDVMSELDEHRRAAVTGLTGLGVQTVITTTNLGYFLPEVLEDAQVIDFGK